MQHSTSLAISSPFSANCEGQRMKGKLNIFRKLNITLTVSEHIIICFLSITACVSYKLCQCEVCVMYNSHVIILTYHCHAASKSGSAFAVVIYTTPRSCVQPGINFIKSLPPHYCSTLDKPAWAHNNNNWNFTRKKFNPSNLFSQ